MNSTLKWQTLLSSIESYTTQEDEDTIIYNALSGETHQLNLIAVDALNFLQQSATLSTLTEHICLLYQTDDIDGINQQMRQLIEQFDDLGLIEPCRT